MSDDEYEQCPPEQQLAIANYYLLSTPIGEFDQVVEDLKHLTDREVLGSNLPSIARKYNLENMVTAENTDGVKTIVCVHGQVDDNKYLEPNSNKVYKFDHIKRAFTASVDEKQSIDAKYASMRSAFQKALNTYVENNYETEKVVAAVYCSDDGVINACISAKNIHLGNFWTGSWRAVYTTSVASSGKGTLKGVIKVRVHYFEDGNVQLVTNVDKEADINISDPTSTALSFIEKVGKFETDYQNALEEMYVKMHKDTFKQMRRFLPITKTEMSWDINKHNIVAQMG